MTHSRRVGEGGRAAIALLIALVGCGGAAFSVDGAGPGDAAPDHDASPSPDAGGGGDAPTGDDGVAPPPADAGDAGNCVTATVTFELKAAGAKSYCVGGYMNTCAAEWLSIHPQSGDTNMRLDAPCTTDCTACQPVACPGVCALPSPLPAGGVSRAWDGTFYTAGTCGSGTACVSPSCAPPGHYVATMCAYARLASDAALGACVGSTSSTCVDVTFDWPPAGGSAVVQGTLGASGSTDGG